MSAMGEFRTPGYDGPEGTEWPRPKRKESAMPEIDPAQGVPADYIGPALLTYECPTHGAHINFDWYLDPVVAMALAMPTNVVPLDQMTPADARALAADLMRSAELAEREIARGKN